MLEGCEEGKQIFDCDKLLFVETIDKRSSQY